MPNATHQATELERSEESSQTPAEPGACKSGGFSVHMLGPEKVDMLSELPDDVLCKMLRFLDIDSAVHCGMLSTRWPVLIDEKVSSTFPSLSLWKLSGGFNEPTQYPSANEIVRRFTLQALNFPVASLCGCVQLFQVLCERVYLDQAQVKVRRVLLSSLGHNCADSSSACMPSLAACKASGGEAAAVGCTEMHAPIVSHLHTPRSQPSP